MCLYHVYIVLEPVGSARLTFDDDIVLYELYDLDVKDLNDKIILEAHEIKDEYDSIYNEDLRDRLRDEQFIEKEEHEMER